MTIRSLGREEVSAFTRKIFGRQHNYGALNDQKSLGRPKPEFIDDPRLMESMNSIYSHPSIIRILQQLWDKDPYTYQHCHRVADLAQWIAGGMGLSFQERVDIYLSGLLHDVGKIFTPSKILLKPGSLTTPEYEIMKLHPQDSGIFVAKIADISYLAPAVRGHHERFDGSGYPDKLKMDKIPLYARIIQVADSFDAMASDRVYRKKLPLEKIYLEFTKWSEKIFDPEVAKTFVAMHKEYLAAKEEDDDYTLKAA